MLRAIILASVLAAAMAQLGREPIPILRQSSDISPEGSFSWEYETANGIKADARGSPSAAGPEGPAVAVQGSWAYVSEDDGQTYGVQYIADENGFQPQGAHLPTPPPIPEAILRSLEFNAKNYKGEDEPEQRAAPRPFTGRR